MKKIISIFLIVFPLIIFGQSHSIDKKNMSMSPMMYVALSYDHRIIDGRESVGFLCKVKEYLENPVEFLFEGNVQKTLNL